MLAPPHLLFSPLRISAAVPELSVVGIEPVKAMREQFEAALPGVRVIEGVSVHATGSLLSVSPISQRLSAYSRSVGLGQIRAANL